MSSSVGGLLGRMWDQQKLASLRAKLEEDRKALLAGDLSALSARSQQLEDLCAQLETMSTLSDPSMEDQLAAIQKAAHRNARLINAARIGLESAEARLKKIAEASAPLNTYDVTGQRVQVSQPVGTSDKRV